MNTYNIKDRIKIKEAYDKLFYPKCCPYYLWIDFCKYMSPIEYNVWCDIRSNGLKFYPQFPVLKYFIDFADPVKKIWIEVDWKDWHLDKEKDKIRQDKIENEWWRIYRVKWKDTYFNEFNFEDYDRDCYDYDEYRDYESFYDFSYSNWKNWLTIWQRNYYELIEKLKIWT